LTFVYYLVLYNWGNGDSGQLGHAKYEKKIGLFGEYYIQEEPRRLLKSKRFENLAVGHKFTLGLDKNNGLFYWGEKFGKQNFFGAENYYEPVKINFDGGRVNTLAAGVKHAALVNDKGLVYTWGSGSTWKIGGQLGHGNSDDVDEPK
jgi:alpha-tubulin suppressor-like RCC1 family protein